MGTNRQKAILAVGGAFNPVHTQHIALMHLVKRVVEETNRYQILSGHLAVAPEGYVRAKLNKHGMKDMHRLAMCNLAIRGHDWLHSCDRTYGSALDCGLRNKPAEDVMVAVVLGADRAMSIPERAKWRYPRKPGVVTVCVGRAGETARVRSCFQADLDAELVVDPDTFLLIDEELSPVSSTLVRSELHSFHQLRDPAKKQSFARRLVDQDYLCEEVVEYILQHEADLYLDF